MTKKCAGCGITLQSQDIHGLGYIKESQIATANYCERCFKTINYNTPSITHLSLSNQEILSHINSYAPYLLYIVDFLSLNQETISLYHQITVPKAIIINKIDIIPQSIKESKITTWLKNTYHINDPIIFLSAQKRININYLNNYLKTNNIPKTYIAGFTNSGKSTLINTLLNNPIEKLTTSLIPNTTYDFIQRITKEKITIIDCPGFTYQETFYQEDEFQLIKKISPKKRLNPKTYKLKKNTGLNIEDKIKIYTSSLNSFTLYISNEVTIKRLYSISKSNKKLNIPENTDLIIKGLGFINIKKPCTILISTTKPNILEIRKSLF